MILPGKVRPLTWSMVGAVTSLVAIASGLLVILNARLSEAVLTGLIGTVIAITGNSIAAIIGTMKADKLQHDLENGLIVNKVKEAISEDNTIKQTVKDALEEDK